MAMPMPMARVARAARKAERQNIGGLRVGEYGMESSLRVTVGSGSRCLGPRFSRRNQPWDQWPLQAPQSALLLNAPCLRVARSEVLAGVRRTSPQTYMI